jgi:hypothetical protein
MRLPFESLYLGNRALPALVLSALVGCGGGAAWAASFTYTALNKAGANVVTPLAISAKDEVVGFTNHDNEGTGIIWSSGTLTLVDGTGRLTAINDEGIAVGGPSDGRAAYASYDIKTGKVSYIPIAFLEGKKGEVLAEGINDAGTVVYSAAGAVNELFPPKEKQSSPLGINKAGDVLVSSGYSNYNPFVYHKGKFKQFAVPGASATGPGFIANSGAIGGAAEVNKVTVGFVKSGANYTTYNPPGAVENTTVTGIGPAGQVYGSFSDGAFNSHGFVYANGSYYQIDIAGAISTSISGVGTSGTIFGVYTDSQGSYGFIGKCAKKDVCTQ